jgi:hypothetical protein
MQLLARCDPSIDQVEVQNPAWRSVLLAAVMGFGVQSSLRSFVGLNDIIHPDILIKCPSPLRMMTAQRITKTLCHPKCPGINRFIHNWMVIMCGRYVLSLVSYRSVYQFDINIDMNRSALPRCSNDWWKIICPRMKPHAIMKPARATTLRLAIMA